MTCCAARRLRESPEGRTVAGGAHAKATVRVPRIEERKLSIAEFVGGPVSGQGLTRNVARSSQAQGEEAFPVLLFIMKVLRGIERSQDFASAPPNESNDGGVGMSVYPGR